MTSLMMGLNNKTAMTLLIGASLLIGVLGGCSDVSVKVDTSCSPATGTRVVTGGEQNDDGGCFTGSFYNGQAAGFWHMSLKRAIGSGENFNCVGTSSKKCPSTPGTCTGGTCKSRYYPLTATTGSCNCGCVY